MRGNPITLMPDDQSNHPEARFIRAEEDNKTEGRCWWTPGRLDVGVLRGTGARADIVAALERVVRRTLDVLALARRD